MRTLRFELGDGVDRYIEERLFVSIFLEDVAKEWPRKEWVKDVSSIGGKMTWPSQRASEMALQLIRRTI